MRVKDVQCMDLEDWEAEVDRHQITTVSIATTAIVRRRDFEQLAGEVASCDMGLFYSAQARRQRFTCFLVLLENQTITTRGSLEGSAAQTMAWLICFKSALKAARELYSRRPDLTIQLWHNEAFVTEELLAELENASADLRAL